MGRNGARVVQRQVALVVEKLDGKARIDGRLVGIGQGTGHVVEVEAHKKLALSEMRWSMRTENWLVSVATLEEVA